MVPLAHLLQLYITKMNYHRTSKIKVTTVTTKITQSHCMN